MEGIRLFAVIGVTSPPVELIYDAAHMQFACRVSRPLPPQLLVFCQGDWPQAEKESEVTLDIILSCEKIGEITATARCFSWDSSSRSLGSEDCWPLLVKVCGLKPKQPAVPSAKKANANKNRTASTAEKSKFQSAVTDTSVDNKVGNIAENLTSTEERNFATLRKKRTTPLSAKNSSASLEKAVHVAAVKESISLKEEDKTPLVGKKFKTVGEKRATTSTEKKTSPLTDKALPSSDEKKTVISVGQGNSPLSEKITSRGGKKTKQTQLNFFEKKSPPKEIVETSRTKKSKELPVDDYHCQKNFQLDSYKQSSFAVKEKLQLVTAEQKKELLHGIDNSRSLAGSQESKKWTTEKQINGTMDMEDENITHENTCNMQVRNETTPQMPNMPSPIPRKPVRLAKKRNSSSSTGDGSMDRSTPYKKGTNTRMRALTSELASPKSVRSKTVLGNSSLNVNTIVPTVDAKQEHNPNAKMSYCMDLSGRAPCPSSRWGHTMLLTQPRCAVLIGGQGERQQLSKDSIWMLHTETRKWRCQEVQSEGQRPENRMGHTATYDPTMHCIYIYGGSKNSKWFHDVHMYDLDENKWSLVKVNGKAPTRAYHTATLYRHELWIFGGVYPRPDPNPDGCSNEVHIFSPVMQNWYAPLVTGNKPLARSGINNSKIKKAIASEQIRLRVSIGYVSHSATLLIDQMVMFGGWDAPYCYNDLFILDMTTLDWSNPSVTGTPPKPRSWHASCALSGRRILIHGGYDGNYALEDSFIFDLGALSWSCLVISNAPSARAGHAAVCLPYNHENQEQDEILVFGGGDNDGTFYQDLFSLSIPLVPVTQFA